MLAYPGRLITFALLASLAGAFHHAIAPVPTGPSPTSSSARLMTTTEMSNVAYEYGVELLENYYLYWKVESPGVTRFALQYNDASKSVAIGFSNTEYMIGSTAVVSSCVDGVLAINAYNINGKQASSVVETNTDLGSPFCTVEADGIVVVHFQLSTETEDYVIDVDGEQYIIYAMGSDPTGYSIWTWGATGAALLNLVTGQLIKVVPGLDMVDAHACLMTLGFGVFMTAGAIVGRFGRILLGFKVFGIPFWKMFHRPMQVLGLLMVIPGLFVAFGMVEDRGNAHLVSTHAIYGLGIVILSTFGVVGGFAAPRERDGRPISKTRAGWITFHRALAVLVVVVAYTNIYLGIGRMEKWSGWDANNDFAEDSRAVLLATMAVIAIFWVVLEMMVCWVLKSFSAVEESKDTSFKISRAAQFSRNRSFPDFAARDAEEPPMHGGQDAKSPEIKIPEGAVRLRQLDTGMIVHLTAEEY